MDAHLKTYLMRVIECQIYDARDMLLAASFFTHDFIIFIQVVWIRFFSFLDTILGLVLTELRVNTKSEMPTAPPASL